MTPGYFLLPSKLWIVQLAEMLSNRLEILIQAWPDEERKRIGDQLRRSSDSVGANISEGYARIHIKEKLHFFSIAFGSLEESIFWIRRARDKNLLNKQAAGQIADLYRKLGNALKHFCVHSQTLAQ